MLAETLSAEALAAEILAAELQAGESLGLSCTAVGVVAELRETTSSGESTDAGLGESTDTGLGEAGLGEAGLADTFGVGATGWVLLDLDS